MNGERERRSAVINVRVLADEKQSISLEASTAGLTVSEYVRRLALHRKVIPATDQGVLNELRRLGGLIKYVYTQGAPGQATSDAIRDLQAFIRRLDRDR